MSQRIRDRIRSGVFARRYVPVGGDDTTPDPFAFDDVGAGPGQVVDSNIITITGIDVPTSAAISMSGGVGQYSKNGGAWTDTLGSVDNFDTVQLRGTASVTPGAVVTLTLTVGGFAAAWHITTAEGGELDFSDPDNSGLIPTI